MQTRTVSTGPGVEIACDESGFSGRNLVRTDTRVFAHASVRLPADAAAWCIGEIRDRARDPTPEYKSGHLLRERDRSLLQWFLGARGPLAGNAHVHLTDKTFFVVGRAISLLVGDAADPVALGLRPDRHADDLAVTLHREGPAAFGPSRWQAFLDAANRLVNGRRTPDATAPVDAFFATLGDLRAAAPPGRAGEIVRLLSRSGMNRTRARLLGDPTSVPALDPFVPAIVAAVVHWSATAGPRHRARRAIGVEPATDRPAPADPRPPLGRRDALARSRDERATRSRFAHRSTGPNRRPAGRAGAKDRLGRARRPRRSAAHDTAATVRGLPIDLAQRPRLTPRPVIK
jgi:hypothetical protein